MYSDGVSRAVGPEVLGRWSTGSGPLYKRLADALRDAVARGDVPVDTRLPAERALARELNVSRNTVVNAYDVLHAEGLLTRRQGSGTWVAARAAAAARRAHLSQVWVAQAALRTIADDPGDVVPFTASTVDRLPGDLPAAALQVTIDELVDNPPYFEVPAGLPQLRAAIARLYDARGLPTSPEQVVVTAGAQEAIALVASAHLAPGDVALVESPTYPGAIDAVRLTGARPQGVPVTRRGADVESIRRALGRGHAGLLYVIPTFHNPTGALMPSSRRAELGELLSARGVPAIDDESLADLSSTMQPPPPLARFAPGAPVYSVGSLSKLFWGGLRIGWVRCPGDAVGPIVRLKSVGDLSSSLVSQVIALKLLGHRDAMMRFRRAQLSAKADLFGALLREHLPSWTFDEPAGGLSLWVDTAVDATGFAQAALREGVAIVPSAALGVDGAMPTHVRLPLALDDALIETGVRRLARAWRRFARARVPERAPRLVV